MICPQCHTENRPDDKFCEQCGSPLQAQAPPSGDGLGATVMAGPGAPCVLVRQGPNGGEVYPLGARAVIGRLDTCDLPIDDRSVSREHARLSRLRDGYVIEDLGSTNGTLVNGQRIHEAVLLHPGDLVSIGSVEFRFDSQGVEAMQDEAEPAFAEAQSSFRAEEHLASPPGRETQDPPTMQDLPPMPLDFPPLEPFAPVTAERQEEPAPQPGPPAFSPFTPTGWEPQPEMSPTPSAPAAGPPATPQEPAIADRVPVSSRESTGVEGDVLGEAVAAVNHLNDLVQQLSSQWRESQEQQAQLEAERDELQQAQARMQERIDQLEEVKTSRDQAKRALQQMPGRALSRDQLQVVQDALDTLARNPRDVEVLMKFVQHAKDVAAVMDEYSQMRRVLDKTAGALGVELPD